MQTNEKIKVAVVEPNTLFLEGFIHLMTNCAGFELTKYSMSGSEVYESFEISEPDILLTPLCSTDWDIVQLMKRTSINYPNLRIVICERINPGPLIKLLLGMGLCTYILKESICKTELIRIIHQVYETGFAPTSVVTQELRNSVKAESIINSSVILSARERDVLLMTCRGESRKAIAEKLCLTEATVKFHLDKLRERMNCQTVVQLVVKSMQEGLISI
ncbi:MAG: response regulator transcription factor [Salibacteraceae bacterium]